MRNSELTSSSSRPVLSSGEFSFAAMTVHRLGFGAMRITGAGIWGPPADHDESIAVLRRAIELGVDFIDTADSYGPHVSEELIKEALHPYPEELVIATKAGLLRTGPNQWHPLGRPEYLRQECEMSLRRLGVDEIDLFQLHRIDPTVPAEDQFGLLKQLLDEGKVRAVGLSEVQPNEIEAARAVVEIATVQNLFNLDNRSSQSVLDYCDANGIGFIPWFPIASGDLAHPGGPLDEITEEIGATPAQVALAWLLALSPNVLPIPGTSSVEHLEENCGAGTLELTDKQLAQLSEASASARS
jgi:aryl-alcohol dehydrogenase-like predicted oxidoreductase